MAKSAAILTLIAALLTLPAAARAGGTITLYDDEKCGGANVTLTADAPDLATQQFADKASSYKAEGKWLLYTGANFTKKSLLTAAGSCVDLSADFNNLIKSVKAPH